MPLPEACCSYARNVCMLDLIDFSVGLDRETA